MRHALQGKLLRALREELFYRLSALTIQVPPLRDRGEDAAGLARHFVERFSARSIGAYLMNHEVEVEQQATRGNRAEERSGSAG